MEPEKQYYSGTSGLVLPVPNKLYFPEQYKNKSRLTYYGSLFNSIEINSSFYKVPKPLTVEKWAAGVPADFKFTFKLHRAFTHQKALQFDPGELSKFIKTISFVGDKKGCLLIQLPPGTKINCQDQLKRLLIAIIKLNEINPWRLVIEFRDPSWYTDEIYQLVGDLGVSIVMHDMPKSFTPALSTAQNIMYVRFHGPAGDYRGSYATVFLQSFASNICRWLQEGKLIYLYFNNTIGGAVHDLINVNRMVAEEFVEY